MNIHFVGITLLASICLPPEQTAFAAGNNRLLLQQTSCEDGLIRDSGAKEIVKGPEYATFQEVAAAFGRYKTPRLYFVPGGGNAAYIARSAILDGKGKILMSQLFVRLMGNTPALKGIMAHEMAHLALDKGEVGCDDRIMRDPKTEETADAEAASKVGFEPLRSFLIRSRELTGEGNAEITLRLRALEELEAKR